MHAELSFGDDRETLEDFIDGLIDEVDEDAVNQLIEEEFSEIIHVHDVKVVLAACAALLIVAHEEVVEDEDMH